MHVVDREGGGRGRGEGGGVEGREGDSTSQC